MRTLILALIVLLAAHSSLSSPVAAQNTRLELGDPPVASRITVSQPDENGFVRIEGAQGSVFGNATVAVRNLYTGETVYTVAGGLGSWSVRMFGAGETPFWISPHPGSVSDARAAFAGSLPGGPGVIIYGSSPAPPPTAIITQIALDGNLDDWSLYPATNAGEARALYNNDSLYIALSSSSFLLNYSQIEIVFTIDTVTYGVRFDPRRSDAPLLRRLNPGTQDLGAIPAAYYLDLGMTGSLEARIPLDFVDRTLRLTFNRVRWLDVTDSELNSVDIALNVLHVEERDGIVRPPPTTDFRDVLQFDAGGIIDGGSWTGRGRATQTGRSGSDVLRLSAGGTLNLELDMRLIGNNLPPSAAILGRIRLQPVAIEDETGTVRAVGDTGTNFGWSSVVTRSGLPIDDVSSTIELGESSIVTVLPHQIIRRAGVAMFALDFALELPADIPTGLYVPILDGAFILPDGTTRAWSNTRRDDPPPIVRLPLVINTGVISSVTIPMALFMDAPSDGARGILPDVEASEGFSVGALSNRVRYNPPTYILTPRAAGDTSAKPYSLEPYLPMMLPNRYTSASAPLLPLVPSSGQIDIRVLSPDGFIADFDVLPIVQNAASSVESDEAALFGTTTPVDMYRLTTFDPRVTAFAFDQYGEYQIDLRAEVSDRFGNRYVGGGIYRVFIAEPLDMLPAVLPGTPFETGDAFHPGVHLYPSVPANLTVRLRVYPIDGSPMIERIFNGRATRFGILSDQAAHGETPFIFQTPGEYTVDYEARYIGIDGRIWAASLRGAGVIAARDELGVVAHGTRGHSQAQPTQRRAWYSTTASGITVRYPYHSGDVLWSVDDPRDRIRASMHVQDVDGAYEDWILNAIDPATLINGESLERRAVEDELPLGFFTPTMPDRVVGTSESYAYISAVRPGVTARQMVTGSLTMDDAGWTHDDPYNRQIGAGFNGNRPGDYTFLFGGTILDYADQRTASIYGSLLVTIDSDDPRGTRIFPPGRGAGGAGDGGALVTVRGVEYDMFFQPTGIRPGDIYRVGDVFGLSGQIAPPLPSRVIALITAPSGTTYTIDNTANRVGYFYDPAASFVLNEPGVWTVDLVVQHEGWTSAGMVEPPYPTGAVLGSERTPNGGGRFSIYVLGSDVDVLDWNPRLTDTLIPPAVSYNFSFTLPAGWRDLRAMYTVATAGHIIDAGEIRLSGRSFTYLYNPSTLSERFEFLENITRSPAQLGAERMHVTDQRILTFYASGIDPEGARRTVARTFVLWYDRLISLH